MSSTNLVPQKALLKAGVATALIAVAAPAVAQEAAPAAMETIVVTGSRIARPDLQASSPVAVVGAEEFKFSGAMHVEEVLHELPQMIPSLGAASNNPGDGVATIDMRGIGASRTLVLVNGRRYVAYDEQQVVDVNTIPAGLIERVDVVTGGRSAIYGSDAISGVVNFILKKDFEGAQISGNYRFNEAGDGDTYAIDGIIGTNFADGKGNVTAYMHYAKRKPIMADAHGFSRQVLGNNGKFGAGSSYLAEGLYIDTLGKEYYGDGGTSLTPHDGRLYNYAPDNYLQTPNERWFLGAFANYEINEHAKVFSEFQYINSRVSQELAPTPIGVDVGLRTDNPFLPQSIRNTLVAIDAAEVTNAATGVTRNDGIAHMSVLRRMNESGSRHQLDDRNAFRALVGLEGLISGNWTYESYYSYARNRNVQSQDGNISYSRFEAALNATRDADGNIVCASGPADCVPINIFGKGAISPEGMAFVTVNSTNLNIIESQVATFAVQNGNLFDLGGGPAGVAFGFEWRSESGAYRPDYMLASGDVAGFNAGEPTSGGYTVRELFGEAVLPLVADKALAHKLELNAAVRYSDYSNKVGRAWSYSAGLMYAPIEDITFRGQYQRAVRAPTVDQLFRGTAVGFPAASDPCQLPVAKTNATLAASCRTNGVPAHLPLGERLPGANSQIESLSGGNPDLTEEKSDTYTIGAVIQPSFLPRFTMTVDYYNITIEDFIATPGTNSVIAACYGDVASGYTPYDTSFCASAPRNPINGLLEGVNNVFGNLGELKTQGVDFEARYWLNVPFGVENDGRLDFRFSGTRLISWKQNTLATVDSLVLNCTGAFGASCGDPFSKWRWSARTTYSTGPLTTSLGWRHVGSAKDDNGAVRWREKVGSYDVFDMSFGYDLNETLSFTAGVNNLFNKKPPLFSDANDQQSNTYPSTYDVFGRQYFFSATAKF